MTPQELETVYEALARGIDAAGPDHAQVYLAKVALALAHDMNDTRAALSIIESCKDDLTR